MKLEQTADGSYTLYVPELDEHYHSVKGALTESQHIFIEMGLKHSPVSEPHILEIGLGTGLNAFLTLLSAEETRRKVHYTGIERYPLAEETSGQTGCRHPGAFAYDCLPSFHGEFADSLAQPFRQRQVRGDPSGQRYDKR